MSVKDVKDRTAEEISTILAPSFRVDITKTSLVPHSDDGGITFPNLDTATQRCKLLETSVLYIDIRRSTELNLRHKPHTVARLYSAFVRAMTRCAIEYRGHVRGIIGDRLMVLFNPSTAFPDAVNTAVLMNSVSKFLLNRHFKANEISCGIGIDFGTMLVTKTGIRRRGVEQHNYKSLVWLGRPANIASKLTDQANKTTTSTREVVVVGKQKPSEGIVGPGYVSNLLSATAAGLPFGYLGMFDFPPYSYADVELADFVNSLGCDYFSPTIRHHDSQFRSFRIAERVSVRKTSPILMTKAVYDGFCNVCPDDYTVKNNFWKPEPTVSIPTPVFGGNVHFTIFDK